MIAGVFLDDDGYPEPFVHATLEIEHLLSRRVVPFLIDSGASATIIHPMDLRRSFGIQIESITGIAGAREEVRLGSGGPAAMIVAPARMTFGESSDQGLSLQVDIRIARPTATNLYLPSLLGWDVLRHFDVRLDYNRRLITLELSPAVRSPA